MHLLIDQLRKGSAPPTPRPPLPNVNQSRNNLMIIAPGVPLSRAPLVPGIITTARFGKFFSLLSSPTSSRPFAFSGYSGDTDDTDDDEREGPAGGGGPLRTRECSPVSSPADGVLRPTTTSRDGIGPVRTTGCARARARTGVARLRSHGRTDEKRIRASLAAHHFIRMPRRRRRRCRENAPYPPRVSDIPGRNSRINRTTEDPRASFPSSSTGVGKKREVVLARPREK